MNAPPSTIKPPDPLRVLDSQPGICGFFAWQNVVIVVWAGPAKAVHVENLTKVTRSVRDLYPQGGSSVHIVRAEAILPDASTREALRSAVQIDSDWLAAVGIVLGRNGFWASTMRSVVTAVLMVTARVFEVRVGTQIDDIATWLPEIHSQRTGVALEPTELIDMLRRADHLAT